MGTKTTSLPPHTWDTRDEIRALRRERLAALNSRAEKTNALLADMVRTPSRVK
jgi:hypothetical protein